MDYKDVRKRYLPEEHTARMEKMPNGWVKDYIKDLEYKLARTIHELSIAKGDVPPSNITYRLPASMHHNNYIPEDSDVRHHLPNNNWIDVRHRGENLELMGSSQISLRPQASNHVLIEVID